MSAGARPVAAVADGSRAPHGLLDVTELTVAFPTARGIAVPVNRVSFRLGAGETLGIVGESGSGKSMTCRAIMGLVAWPGAIVSGSIRWNGEDLAAASEKRRTAVRGREISMIFQDPTSALNPVFTVGEQIAESLRVHLGYRRSGARREAISLLDRVGIPSAAARFGAYPHEMSGGMRQRAMIAAAIACRPQLILADEPTTNLDVTIQDQILNLLADLQRDQGMAMILVSHDLGVVSQNARSVAVMYAGHLVEHAPTEILITGCRHPYTAGLIGALPTIYGARPRLEPIPGQPPELDQLPDGCPFQPRCGYRRDACTQVDMTLIGEPAHRTACPFVTHEDIHSASTGGEA
jgi:oligopeptide/dipeptide ABC transporter ATP-binding protein